MKTKTTQRLALSAAALMAFGVALHAQNTTFSASTFPIGGSSNSVFGKFVLLSTTGGANTGVGFNALQNNTSGSVNTAVGVAALIQNVSGQNNTAMGVKCMDATTIGNSNVAMGSYALNGNVSGSNNSAFGFGANVSSPAFTNASAIGSNAIVNASDRIWLGSPTATVWTQVVYMTSDGRFKRNISDQQVKGLDFIKLLRPVTYNFDGRAFTEHITKNMSEESRKNYLAQDFTKSDNGLQTGFIAQEVEQAAKTVGYNFSGVHSPEGETDTYGISYYQFVVPLVKAVQEQQQMIDAQNTQIASQKSVNDMLQQQISDLQKAVGKTTGISTINTDANLSMEQNEPNPFTHETTVRYTLPASINNAYMAVYDLSGKQLATFPITQKGSSSIVINSEKLSAGIYIYNIVADGKVFDSKKMIVADK